MTNPVEIAKKFKALQNDKNSYIIESVQLASDFLGQIKKIAEEKFIKDESGLLDIIWELDIKYQQATKMINDSRPDDFPYLAPNGFLNLLSLVTPSTFEYYQKYKITKK